MLYSIFVFGCYSSLITGIFLCFGIRVKDILSDLSQLARRPPTMKQIVAQANGISGNFITRRFEQMKNMLILSGREKLYGRYCRVSFFLAILCASAAFALENYFLVPIISLFGLFVPQLFIFISATGYKRQSDREAQTAMSIITSSYMRTENLLQSIAENIDYIHEPIKSIFKQFLARNEFLTTNIEKSIIDMKSQVKNDVWKEWCEALILCQHDRTKKDMLDPIISKLRNMDSVQTELDAMLYKPVKDFVVMVILVLVNFPILFFINRAWFDILLFSLPGKIAITITFAALLFALFSAMKALKPLEYKR